MKNDKKIAIICGARPNFMKVAPLCKEFKTENINYFVVNTGQHFDAEMSSIFFKDFGLNPDYNLALSKKSIIQTFSDILIGLENIFLKEKPDLIIVVGDVNSTLAGALVANKMNIKLAHIEAGLRSYNKKMQEEVNRVMIDSISDFLFITMQEGIDNLKKEGITNNIYFVGNIMIDVWCPPCQDSNIGCI